MPGLESAGTILVAAVLILLVLAILKIPVKFIFKLLINTLIGFAALLLINFAGNFIGISITVNWINAAITGIFGLAGVALILLLQWLLAI